MGRHWPGFVHVPVSPLPAEVVSPVAIRGILPFGRTRCAAPLCKNRITGDPRNHPYPPRKPRDPRLEVRMEPTTSDY
ncbi:hypothetical protein LI90_1041 [Carbonactinospora thermoautotrophica]|uniref:Uncharacterized protein n=1 Tax=Carbonactinospora thermoautotrophica TaxID=1469144 RepID=A0A132MNH2_9ACTN|nr:hypothetical protein LI90_1041 [Carbonactinospora thermoautotrophica]